jgi:hypothetical protein
LSEILAALGQLGAALGEHRLVERGRDLEIEAAQRSVGLGVRLRHSSLCEATPGCTSPEFEVLLDPHIGVDRPRGGQAGASTGIDLRVLGERKLGGGDRALGDGHLAAGRDRCGGEFVCSCERGGQIDLDRPTQRRHRWEKQHGHGEPRDRNTRHGRTLSKPRSRAVLDDVSSMDGRVKRRAAARARSREDRGSGEARHRCQTGALLASPARA